MTDSKSIFLQAMGQTCNTDTATPDKIELEGKLRELHDVDIYTRNDDTNDYGLDNQFSKEGINFIAIDLETATADRNSICEIGIAIVEQSEVKTHKSWLIRPPHNQYDESNTKIHGIRPEDTADAPTFKEAWPTIAQILDGHVVVAHNTTFDAYVLRDSLLLNGTAFPSFPIFCSYRTAKNVIRDCRSYSLPKICETLDIPLGRHHRAEDDAVACANIFLKCIERSGCNSFFDLQEKHSFRCGRFSDKYFRPQRVDSISERHNSGTQSLGNRAQYDSRQMHFPYTTEIAGLRYHYDASWPASFPGYVKADPANTHDPNAIGIYTESGDLVGYVPRNDTSLLRAWAACDMYWPLECFVTTDVSERYNIYRGSAVILPPAAPSYTNGPYSGKKIYIKAASGADVIDPHILKVFGAEKSVQLSRTTDYVIYDGETTNIVKDRMDDERYHFKTLTVNEFIKSAIPEADRNPLLFGKTVSPATAREGDLAIFLEKFLLMAGAIYRPRYSKTCTDIVVQWDDYPTVVSKKAIQDGKTVLRFKDLMPGIYEALCNDHHNSSSTPSASHTDNRYEYDKAEITNPANETYDFSNKATPSDTTKKQDTDGNWSGCLFLIILAALIGWIIL